MYVFNYCCINYHTTIKQTGTQKLLTEVTQSRNKQIQYNRVTNWKKNIPVNHIWYALKRIRNNVTWHDNHSLGLNAPTIQLCQTSFL